MSRAAIASGLLMGLSVGLAGCGEKPQTATQRKAVGHAYNGPTTVYTAGTWKAGDETAWDAQLRIRAQGQNEYSRTGSPP